MAGAPLGNQNAVKENRRWAEALNRAIAQDDGKRLRTAAENLLNQAAAGEPWAIREIADRLDGKPKQQIEASGPDGGPIETINRIERVLLEGTETKDP